MLFALTAKVALSDENEMKTFVYWAIEKFSKLIDSTLE